MFTLSKHQGMISIWINKKLSLIVCRNWYQLIDRGRENHSSGLLSVNLIRGFKKFEYPPTP